MFGGRICLGSRMSWSTCCRGNVKRSRRLGHVRDLPFRRVVSALAISFGLFLGACESGPERGEVAIVEGFAGLVAGDEPRAVVVGRDVLGGGATAADAAVAMYFTMAVTMPSRAGLGGGGVCVVFSSSSYDDGGGFGEAYDFLQITDGDRAAAPVNARAMALLHARAGLRRWETLLAPAEQLARFGHPVSRALARDLRDAGGIVLQDPSLRRAFSNAAGELAREGDVIIQEELSTVIGGIRGQGAGYLYTGPFARRLAEAASRVGPALTPEQLQDALPRIGDALTMLVESDLAYFAPPRSDGGLVSAQMWQLMTEVQDFASGDVVDRAHLFAEASMAAFADRAAWLNADGTSNLPAEELAEEGHLERVFSNFSRDRHRAADDFDPPPVQVVSNPYSAGFVVADRWGGAVACSFTMNGLFGSGKVAPGTGILLAAPAKLGAANLTPLVIANKNTGDFRFAASATGGLAAPAALVQTMLLAVDRETPLLEAVDAPRLTHVGSPDITWVEPGVTQEVRDGLRARGHNVQEAPQIGVISALHCPGGILDNDSTCEVATDRRGFGFAARAQ